MLYNDFEKPVIYIKLFDNQYYLDNIDRFIEIANSTNVIIEMSKESDFYHYINYLIKKYTHINFYIQKKIKYICKENCFFWTKFSLLSVLFNKRDFIFLNIDIGKKNAIMFFILNHISNKNIICSFVNKHNVDLLNYEITLRKIQNVKNIKLNTLFVSYETIINHPCNLYLCSNSNCHSNKNGLPKYLYITKDGIFPYSLCIEKFVFLKEISKKNIFDIENQINYNYKKSKEYLLLKKCFEKIYNENILTRRYRIIAKNIFLESAIKDVQD